MREIDRVRGKLNTERPYDYFFWDRFPELLMDDPEDKYNYIVRKLRNVAQEYFKEVEEYQKEMKRKFKEINDK